METTLHPGITLASLGWDDYFETRFTEQAAAGLWTTDPTAAGEQWWHLTARYYKPNDTKPVGSARAWLPDDLPPGHKTQVQIDIPAPEKPGRYALKFDLVSEGIDWFEKSGSPTTVRDLVVR